MLLPLVTMPLRVFIGSGTLDALALAASGVRVALGCLALRQVYLDHRDLPLDPLQQYAMALCIALGFSLASGGLEEFGDEIIPSFDRFERLILTPAVIFPGSTHLSAQSWKSLFPLKRGWVH